MCFKLWRGSSFQRSIGVLLCKTKLWRCIHKVSSTSPVTYRVGEVFPSSCMLRVIPKIVLKPRSAIVLPCGVYEGHVSILMPRLGASSVKRLWNFHLYHILCSQYIAPLGLQLLWLATGVLLLSRREFRSELPSSSVSYGL